MRFLGKEAYKTKFGKTYLGDSLELMQKIPDNSIDLVFTSPPYALHFKKEYGNEDQKNYNDWFLSFAKEIKRVLKDSGSFVLNIGGTWTPKVPTRSLYIYKLVIKLCDDLGFNLLQDFFWYNPAKMPAPAEWVNVRRIRVKDSVEYLYWFGKNPFPKADNKKVLQPYSKDMLRLIKKGLKSTVRPSGHVINESFSQDKGGSIPSNIIISGNNESNSAYMKLTKESNQKIHPARFPAELPKFFIEFLTDPGDIILDPFSGSNTTGQVAEELQRKWISIEINPEYVKNSKLRFEKSKSKKNNNSDSDLFSAVAF
ncbi:DNA-methyltransferase [Leptospira interrogans]|uniref:DNA-methyltransferase n=1 Tax=Leptospira interrogans TaxID=173 RepID=UPI000513EA22|nr:site-specific DNA-methyltransferase [Leptospira interrogans]KGE21948.1 DNA methyltransferase [Leptospira interrogans serovar Lai]